MRLRLLPLLLLPAAAAVVTAYSSPDGQQSFNTPSEEDPKDYMAFFKRAAVSLSQGKYSSALSDFNKILELKPDFDQARLQRAKILLRDGSLETALKDAKTILKHSPKDKAAESLLSSIETTATSIKQAKAAEAAKDWESCAKHLSIATQGASALASLRLMRANCNLARGEVEEAAGDLTRGVHLDPSTADPQITLAQLNYFSLYTPETALPHLKQCLHYDPEHKECKAQFRVLKKFAKDLEKIENDASAGKWASATGRLLGTGAAGAGTKGLIKEEEEMINKIQKRLSITGLKLPRRLAGRLHELACQGFSKLKDGEKGHKYCTSALEFDENNINALIGLGESQMLLSDYEIAVRTLSKASEMTGQQNRKVQEALEKAQRLLQQSKRKDYYKVLGVPRDASQKEIKKAYRKLAVEWHPDKRDASEKELAMTKMGEINEANEILSNEELRAKFDNGEDPNDPHGGHDGGNPFHAGGFPHAFFQQGSPFGGGSQFKFHFE